jgi:hypothetical protein
MKMCLSPRFILVYCITNKEEERTGHQMDVFLQIPAKNKHLHGQILQFSCQKLNNNGIKENNSPLSFDVLLEKVKKMEMLNKIN